MDPTLTATSANWMTTIGVVRRVSCQSLIIYHRRFIIQRGHEHTRRDITVTESKFADFRTPQLFFRPESNRSTLLERSETNAHRCGAHSPPGPPADVEQAGGRRADRIGRQLAAESSAARNARSGPNGWTSAGPPRKLKVGPRGQRMRTRMEVRDEPSLRREDSAQ